MTATTFGVSVVIPARNAASTIAQQIGALRDQYDGSFEVILVDNASTDNTAEVARGAAGKMPLTILYEPRLGANVARNAGVAHAQCEKIILCDSDDIVGNSWVVRLSGRIQPGCWVSGQVDFERLNSSRARVIRRRPPTFLDSSVVGTWGCNCGFTKSDWSGVGGFDERLRAWGDETEFFHRMSMQGKTGIAVAEAIVYYRLRPGFRNLLRDEFRIGVGHERMVRLGVSDGLLSTNRLIGRSARILAHLGMIAGTFWSLRLRARHLSGIAYHAGRIAGRFVRIEESSSVTVN